ncbi:hypothetical protein [Burkholderia ubonensis]|uniref:hypothetical protein n=1 Tax=Burkholderia ubonensis TaxID=101571 RepID=UPI001E4EBB85|nr:hypothetical protein [Burkholderia ubonensis]
MSTAGRSYKLPAQPANTTLTEINAPMTQRLGRERAICPEQTPESQQGSPGIGMFLMSFLARQISIFRQHVHAQAPITNHGFDITPP